MKKLLLISFTFLLGNSFSQNTFPTSGNAGINTTSPAATLHVIGTVRIDSSMTVQDSINVQGRTRTFELIVEGESKFLGDVVMKDELKVDSTIKAKSNVVVDGETKMHGDAKAFANFAVEGTSNLNGNVKMEGISSTEPDTLLNLMVLTPTGQVKMVDFTNIYNLYKTPGFIPCEASDVPMPQWYFDVNELYTPCDPVKVGIGTPDPTHKLTVMGTTYSRKFHAGKQDATQDAVINGFAVNTSDDLLILGRKPGGAQTEKFKVANNGGVTITKNGASAALTINSGTGNALVVKDNSGFTIMQIQGDGLMRAREVKVDLTVWPDYVFEPNYQLMTLPEVELYIVENGHLPNTPSAEEIECSGLNLGEIQKVQMEKIEELTLYSIDLNKEVEQLKEENQQMKNELDVMKERMAAIEALLQK